MKAINRIFSILILSFILAVCGFFATINISWAKAEETQTEISLNIESNSVSYSDSVYLLYAVSFENVDYQNIKMLFWDEPQDDYILSTEKYQVSYSGGTTINGKNCLVFYSNGLAAKEMTDDIYARAYIQVEGETYYSPVEKFSVLEYVYTMREKDTDSDTTNDLGAEEKNLLTAMLNYGTAAQEFFGYNIDRLANDTYYKVEVENGKLADGFTSGRYLEGQTITITANEPAEGYEFLYWLDSYAEFVSEEATCDVIIADENVKYYAVYKSIDGDDTIGDDIEVESKWQDKDNMFPFPIEWMDLGAVASTYNARMMMNRSVALLSSGEETQTEISLNIESNSVSYSDSVYLLYAVSFENVDYQNIKMLFWDEPQDDYILSTEKYQVSYSGGTTINGKSCLVFYSNGLAAKEMTDDIYARAYIQVDGETYYSPVEKFSVLEYVYTMREKDTDSDTTNDLGAEEKNLLTAMLNYGTAAQEYFGYNVDRLANDTYYKVEVENGKLADGFTSGRYLEGEIITITANEPAVGKKFSHWQDSEGNVVCTDSTYQITIAQENVYTAVYKDKTIIGDIALLGADLSYNGNVSQLLPSTITFDYDGEMIELEVSWGVEDFSAQVIGEQNIYATLVDNSAYAEYGVGEISLPVNVLPYSIENGILTGYYGDETDLVLPSVYNGMEIYAIGEGAFENNASLISIQIPSTIISIGDMAFNGCTALTSIIVAQDNANYSAKDGNLYSKDGTVLIQYAIGKTETAFAIPEDVVSIEKLAFNGCTQLNSIALPASVIEIGESAFVNCLSLTMVNYLGTMSEWINIEFNNQTSNPLYNAKNLYINNALVTEIELVSDVEIASYAFYNCTSLESIIIPETVATIGADAFYGCDNLTIYCIAEVKPSGWAENWNSSNCDVVWGYKEETLQFTLINNDTEYGVSGYVGEESEVVIPAEYKGKPVTKIIDSAFNGLAITSIEIPSSIKVIGNGAFNNCASLTYVNFLGTVDEWVEIEIGNTYSSPTRNSKDLYINSELVTEVKLTTATKVSARAFYQCESIETIEISNTVTSIGEYAFRYCTSLTSIFIADSVTEIGQYTFDGCTLLESVKLPNGLTSLESHLFQNCKALQSIEIPSSVTNIADLVFYNTTSLTSIYIPASVVTMGAGKTNGVIRGCATSMVIYCGADSQPSGWSSKWNYNSRTVVWGYQAKIDQAINAIDAIGTVTLSDMDVANRISNARATYDAIDIDIVKKCVTNYDILVMAEQDFAFMMTEVTVWKDLVDLVQINGNITTTNINDINAVETIYNGWLGSADERLVDIANSVKVCGSTYSYDKYQNLIESRNALMVEMGEIAQEMSALLVDIELISLDPTAFNNSVTNATIRFNTLDASIKAQYYANSSAEYKSAYDNYSQALNLYNNVYRLIGDIIKLGDPTEVTLNQYNNVYRYLQEYDGLSDAYKAIVNDGGYKEILDIAKVRVDELKEENDNSGLQYQLINNDTEYAITGYKGKEKVVVIPDMYLGLPITTVIENAFVDCGLITNLVIPNSVVTIGYGALQGLTALESLTIPFVGQNRTNVNNAYIGYMFGLAQPTEQRPTHKTGIPSSLSDIIITSNTKLGAGAIAYLPSLERLEIAEGVTEAGYGAFAYNENLTEVILPNSLVTYGFGAFACCSSLSSIEIPYGTSVVNDAMFIKCTSLSSVTIPNSVSIIEDSAFAYCSSLVSIVIPNSVSTIGYGAFAYCSELAEIQLGSGVTLIEEYAFMDCNKLANVNYMGTIDKWAQIDFEDYTSTPLNYADGLYINGSLVTNIVLSSATKISNYAFFGYDLLTSVTIPSTVTSIGYAAFSDCYGLTSVSIPSSVTSIEGYAFYRCTSLSSITISGSELASIGEYAFNECNSLISIILPESVSYIGYRSFRYCNALTIYCISDVEPPIYKTYDDEGKVTAEYPWNPTNCPVVLNYNNNDQDANGDINIAVDGVKYIIQNGKAIVARQPNTVTMVNIPSTITHKGSVYTVTAIGDRAFYNCRSLTSITLPTTITSIGERAFYYCTELSTITLPDNVTTIGHYAFDGCKALSQISIPNNLTSMGTYALRNCDSLTYTVENGLMYLGNSNNKYIYLAGVVDVNMTQAVLNSNCKMIGSYAFSDCTLLTSVTIPTGVSAISFSAFYNCPALTIYCQAQSKPTYWDSYWNSENNPVVWNCNNNNVADNGYIYVVVDGIRYALKGKEATVAQQVKNITSINIPASVTYSGTTYSVTSIVEKAFEDCYLLEDITLPNSLVKVGDSAFNGCNKLKYNHADDVYELNYLGNSENPYLYLAGANDIEIITTTIDANCKIIGSYAFYNCDQLGGVDIPDGVLSIGSYAFAECDSLGKITIPNSIVHVGDNVFAGSSSLSYTTTGGLRYLGNSSNKYLYLVGVSSSSITTATIRNTCRFIDSLVFAGYTNLTSVTIPESVEIIGRKAFDGCETLTIYCITKSKPVGWNSSWNSSNRPVVWDCENNDFADDGNTYITQDGIIFALRDGIVTVAKQTQSLKEIVIPSKVTYEGVAYDVTAIGENAFSECYMLTSVTIPTSITTIDSTAFYNCTTPTIYCVAEEKPTTWSQDWNSSNNPVVWNCNSNKVAEDGNIYATIGGIRYAINIDSAVATVSRQPKNITKIVIPKEITYDDTVYEVIGLGDYAFAGCTLLTSVTYERYATIESIGNSAFEGCIGLTEIIILETVTFIGERAFYGCTSVMSIDIPASVKKIGRYAFYDCHALVNITFEEPSGWRKTPDDYKWGVSGMGSGIGLSSYEWNATNLKSVYAKYYLFKI